MPNSTLNNQLRAGEVAAVDNAGGLEGEPLEIVHFASDDGSADASEDGNVPMQVDGGESSSGLQDTVGGVARIPHVFWHPLRATGWAIQTAFGIVTLILMLAILAAIPLVNFLALGYLLETEGRLARSGKFRMAFPILDLAPRIGTITMGIWLWLFPIVLFSGAAADAFIIDPTSQATVVLRTLRLMTSVFVAVHLCLALARGGSVGCFLRPVKNLLGLISQINAGDFLERAGQEVHEFVKRMRLRHHFSLGLRGFLGAMAWLIVPTGLFATADKTEGGPILVTIFGGLCLVPILCWLPFLQAHFAAENRLRAIFELRKVRQLFRNAPVTWLLTTVVVYVLALPLYLLKVVLPPSDAMWLITIVFIVSIYPTRVLVGWAYHRARTQPKPAWYGLRWMSRTVLVPLVGLYVFLLFFTQFIGEHGKGVLFEHHAFLLPVPF